MVYRPPVARFQKFHIRNKLIQQLIMNPKHTTLNDAIYPRIPFLVRAKKYNIKSPVDNTPSGQLYGLSLRLTDLFRDERIVLNYNKGTEIRTHAERLIVEAIRNGDRHKPTMELANYWLREKNLVHKLFKVFVPRYENYASAFTAIHMLGIDYEKYGLTMTERSKMTRAEFDVHPRGEVVLEMRGNCLPPIKRPSLDRRDLLTNVLLNSARENSFHRLQQERQQAQPKEEETISQ